MSTDPASRFQDVFVTLNGTWKLVREISDGSRFVGNADFTFLCKDKIRLCEDGILTLPDLKEIPASRSWLWEVRRNNLLDIFYDEEPPRPYHSVPVKYIGKEFSGEADHLCDRDLYSGSYTIAKDRIEIAHRVSGPKKDYRLVSVFSR